MATSYLERIVAATRDALPARRAARPVGDLEREARAAPAPRDFTGAVCAPGISLIAEIKRRSPSAGEIRPGAEPGEIASAFERGGARALSVVTEPRFFGGSLDDLAAARAACPLPALRKDFVLDAYQVVEARAAGADAVLLIVAALEQTLLAELAAAAAELGLAALVEVHDEAELERALAIDPNLVGVNQRNLAAFEVDQSLAARLRREVPPGVGFVAESGIGTRADVEALEDARVDAMLVGESLMRADDPARAASSLLGGGPRGSG